MCPLPSNPEVNSEHNQSFFCDRTVYWFSGGIFLIPSIVFMYVITSWRILKVKEVINQKIILVQFESK